MSSSNPASKGFAPTYSKLATDEPVLTSIMFQRPTSGGLRRGGSASGMTKYSTGFENLPARRSSGAYLEGGLVSQRWLEETPVKEEEVGTSWKVEDSNVPEVPPHFPIMATHVTVNGESAAAIANRIERCLYEWSISARFNSEKAKVVAETSDHVRFCIRMFRDDNSGIIVEVQRRSGGCMGFHIAARAIMRAAQDLEFSQSGLRRLSASCIPVLSTDSPIRDHAQEACGLGRCMKYVKGTIDAAQCLMNSPQVDAKLLGAESLKLLTDPSAAGEEVSRVAARAVLASEASCGCQVADGEDDAYGEDDEDGGPVVFQPVNLTVAIKAMVELFVDNDEDGEDFDSDYHFEDGPLRRYMELLHSHALSIMTNSISNLSRSGELKAIMDDDDWYEEAFIPILLRDMGEADMRPNDASAALRCLTVLAECSCHFRDSALREGVTKHLAVMQKACTCRHARLRRELQTASAAFLSHHQP